MHSSALANVLLSMRLKCDGVLEKQNVCGCACELIAVLTETNAINETLKHKNLRAQMNDDRNDNAYF